MALNMVIIENVNPPFSVRGAATVLSARVLWRASASSGPPLVKKEDASIQMSQQFI